MVKKFTIFVFGFVFYCCTANNIKHQGLVYFLEAVSRNEKNR